MKIIGNLSFNEKQVAEFCQRNDIVSLALFGSMLHKDNENESDIDLLVKFNKPKSLLDLVGIEDDLSNSFGKKVDLVTEGFLSPYFRNDVMKSAKTLYEEKKR